MEQTQSEIEQIRTEITQILAERLGIKQGSVTFPIPPYTVESIGGKDVKWAFQAELKRDDENSGRFIYRGPWHEDYFEAVKLALKEVSL